MKEKIKLLYDIEGQYNGTTGQVIEVDEAFAERAISTKLAVVFSASAATINT